jgi:hypothetical protein
VTEADRDETETDDQEKSRVMDSEMRLEATAADNEPKRGEPGEHRSTLRQVGDMLKDTINTVTGPDGDLGGDQTYQTTEPEATKPSST